MAERDDIYDPTTPEANHNIQQGGGVGARDLARQEEPTEIVPENDPDEAPTEAMGLAHPVE
ncbi:hypothetical protein ACN2C7_00660 [Caulobacter sp. ErkDOM-E]|uniref:hypothetical protein n=1 Tax=Caulobacter sp. ErkDOM-E TaxID=3402778 RepID=UPI003AF6660A